MPGGPTPIFALGATVFPSFILLTANVWRQTVWISAMAASSGNAAGQRLPRLARRTDDYVTRWILIDTIFIICISFAHESEESINDGQRQQQHG